MEEKIEKQTNKKEVSKTNKEEVKETKTNKTPIYKTKRFKNSLIIVLALAILLGALYYAKNLFIAAMVNGNPITRVEVIRELEKQSGEQALNTIITKKLISQKAQEQGINVTEEEVQQEIATVEQELQQQGQSLEQALNLQGLTVEDLKEQLQIQLTLEKLVGDRIEVSEEEINNYIEENSSFLPEDQDTSAPQFRTQVGEQLKNQKLNQQIQSFIQEIRDQANIEYFINY